MHRIYPLLPAPVKETNSLTVYDSMKDFPIKQFLLLNEWNVRSMGYQDVKAVNIEGDAPVKDNPEAAKLLADGYRVIDENYYGVGNECKGRAVVFVKGEPVQ